MRVDISKKQESDVMYSAIGYKGGATSSDPNVLDTVQNGMVGALGSMVEYDTYEFLPLKDGDTEAFIMATPEVDADESSIEKNTLKGYLMTEGQIGDITILKRHTCIAIDEAGIEGLPTNASTAVGKYVYATSGKRLLQYKATMPTSTDKPVIVGIIENVKPATSPVIFKQGTVANKGLTGMGLSYNLVEVRFL